MLTMTELAVRRAVLSKHACICADEHYSCSMDTICLQEICRVHHLGLLLGTASSNCTRQSRRTHKLVIVRKASTTELAVIAGATTAVAMKGLRHAREMACL